MFESCLDSSGGKMLETGWSWLQIMFKIHVHVYLQCSFRHTLFCPAYSVLSYFMLHPTDSVRTASNEVCIRVFVGRECRGEDCCLQVSPQFISLH